MMEAWRKNACEKIEASCERIERLAKEHKRLATSGPKRVVDEWGIHNPRRTHAHLATFYTHLVEASRETVRQIENGARH